MTKEFKFFAYLLECYAVHKDTTADKILETLDEKNLTQFVYDMYELYHSEAIENAFTRRILCEKAACNSCEPFSNNSIC